MKRSFIIQMPLFFFVMILTNTKIAYGQLSADSIKYIIQREVDNKRSASIAVGIINPQGKTVICAGKVRDNSNEPPDGNTVYEIGSITKVFTSLLLADMVVKKHLKLNDPISKFLPTSIKTPTRNGKEITLLDLATHTSSLPRMPDNFNPKNPDNPYADYTDSQFYSFLSNYTLTRDIGSKYEYSNYGVALLGHILTIVGGSDYETLVKERICKPLNMNNTVVTLNQELKDRLATGHNEYGKPVSNWDLPSFAGAGALRSTVNDMLIFTAANLGLIKTNLDSAIALTHMIQDSTGIPNLYVALGWHILKKYGKQIIWHNGGTGGYRTFIGLDEATKTGVVVLSSSANSVDDIALHILDENYPIFQYTYQWYVKDTIASVLNNKGSAAAIELYKLLKTSKPQGFIFNEDQLNMLGYELLNAKKLSEAIAIFKLNTEEYPTSWNVFDSMGEAYMANGDNKLAIENYQKSVDLNPKNTNGIEMLKKLKGNN